METLDFNNVFRIIGVTLSWQDSTRDIMFKCTLAHFASSRSGC